MANNVGSALDTLLTSGQTFYAPFADKGSGEVSLVASGAGASQSPTFTRATTATTVNSAGLIVSVASGTPRSYYDPTTLAYRGYLAEGARTNLCLQSNVFTTTWVPTNLTPVQNVTSPDGTANGWTFTESVDGGIVSHQCIQSITVANTTAHTFSMWVKKGVRTQVYLTMVCATTVAAGLFDVNAGTVGSIIGAATITACPDGWYRCTITGTSDSTTASVRMFSKSGGVDYQGNGSIAFYGFGAQLEAGSFASSYIPTTTASVPRNADVLTYPFSGNASASVGSAYAELSTFWTTSGASAAVAFSVADACLWCPGTVADTTIRILDGLNSGTKTGLTSMSTASRKRASSWGGSTLSVTGDGASVASNTFDGGIGSTSIGIGNFTDGSTNWFGTIRNVRIYQTQLSSAQLQAVTA